MKFIDIYIVISNLIYSYDTSSIINKHTSQINKLIVLNFILYLLCLKSKTK